VIKGSAQWKNFAVIPSTGTQRHPTPEKFGSRFANVLPIPATIAYLKLDQILEDTWTRRKL
jgi:hypothetical protein